MALNDEYEQLLYKLLPPGPAWEGENPLIEGLAPSLTRVHQRANALMKEIDPAQTTELIDRYETVYGLPDSCTPDGVQSLRQRQQRLDAKANVAGGINEQFYRNQLDALGYTTATIEQFQNLDSTPDPEWGVLALLLAREYSGRCQCQLADLHQRVQFRNQNMGRHGRRVRHRKAGAITHRRCFRLPGRNKQCIELIHLRHRPINLVPAKMVLRMVTRRLAAVQRI